MFLVIDCSGLRKVWPQVARSQQVELAGAGLGLSGEKLAELLAMHAEVSGTVYCNLCCPGDGGAAAGMLHLPKRIPKGPSLRERLQLPFRRYGKRLQLCWLVNFGWASLAARVSVRYFLLQLRLM